MISLLVDYRDKFIVEDRADWNRSINRQIAKELKNKKRVIHIQYKDIHLYSSDITIYYDSQNRIVSNVNLNPFLYLFHMGRFQPSDAILHLMQKLIYFLTETEVNKETVCTHLLASHSLAELLSKLELQVKQTLLMSYIEDMQEKPVLTFSEKITVESIIIEKQETGTYIENDPYLSLFSILFQIMLLSENIDYLILDETQILKYIDLQEIVNLATHVTCSYNDKQAMLQSLSEEKYTRLFKLEEFHRSAWCKGVQKVLNNIDNLPN